MIEFLLKASSIVGIALLFYKVLLQQETFFKANRIFFISFIAMAFLSPFVSLPELVKHQGYLSDFFEPSIEPTHTKPRFEKKTTGPGIEVVREGSETHPVTLDKSETKINSTPDTYSFLPDRPIEWFLTLYFFGVIVFTLNLLMQTGNIFYKIFKISDKIRDGKYIIVNTSTPQAPCSFFNYIFIHPDSYDFETYEQIIAHEKIHAREKHSWDLLVAELGVIILWFNPLAWIYKSEVEKNIEYETDAILLKDQEVEKDQYQLNLLQIATPNKPLTITTNYNQSLLKQRIVMMNSKKSTISSYWKYSFALPLILASLLFLNKPIVGQTIPTPTEPVAPPVSAQPKPIVRNNVAVRPNIKNTTRVNININGEDMSHGFWYGYQKDNEYCIEFKGISKENRWNISECFPKTSFTKSGDNSFTMTNETGTLKLTGPLDQEVSQGKYEFIKDASFESFLSQNNLLKSDQNVMFHLFLNDVTRKYVEYLKNKFKSLNGDDLLAMAIHGVTRDYIESLESAGFKELDKDQFITAKIHGVNAENIKEMRALGFGDLDFEEMISMRIHGVNKKFIEELKAAGFNGLKQDEVVQAKIHGVNPESIKEIRALGFDNLTLDKIMELRIHGINSAYIADLKGAGFKDLDLDEIIQAKIHGLDPESIKEIQSLGFKDLSFEKITELKLHGLNAAYLKDLKEAGFSDLTVDQAMEAKIHGLNAGKIKDIRSLGYSDLSFRKMIDAQIHGINKEFIEGIKKSGIKNADFNDIINAKIHGVNEQFIKQMRDDGYDYEAIDDYINLKIHGLMRNSKRKNNSE